MPAYSALRRRWPINFNEIQPKKNIENQLFKLSNNQFTCLADTLCVTHYQRNYETA